MKSRWPFSGERVAAVAAGAPSMESSDSSAPEPRSRPPALAKTRRQPGRMADTQLEGVAKHGKFTQFISRLAPLA